MPAGVKLAAALKEAGLVASNSEANRKIAEGAVRVDGNKTTDRETRLAAGRGIHPAARARGNSPACRFHPLKRALTFSRTCRGSYEPPATQAPENRGGSQIKNQR